MTTLHLQNQDSKLTRGFTIIETLVAIAVLMIAIAGPLVIATKGLNSAVYSKDQMIASFLARESMEVIKNKKANNIQEDDYLVSVSWLEGITDASGVFDNKCYDSDNVCDASPLDLNNIDKSCSSGPPKGCQIYYSETAGYTHDSGSGTKTLFRRYYYIDDSSERDPSIGGHERTVHVFVDWDEGSVPYQIHVTSQMTDNSMR